MIMFLDPDEPDKGGRIVNAAREWCSDEITPFKLQPGSFSKAAALLEEIVAENSVCWQGLGRAVFFQASLLTDGKNPSDKSSHAELCALILAFPEMFWVPVDETTEQPSLPKKPGASQRTSVLPSNLFDGCGFREQVKEKLMASIPDLAGIRRRPELALALDEEQAYSDANAYALFRQGYRAFSLVTHQEAGYILGNSDDIVPASETVPAPRFSISIEDRDLRFPDYRKSENKKLDPRLLLTDRTTLYPGLKQVVQRWLCSLDNAEMDAKEEAFLAGRIIAKPYPGIYALLDKLQKGGLQGGPARSAVSSKGGEATGHSAPGEVLWLAEILIRRAERILKNDPSPVDAIRGSVLALEAEELLCGLSATTSFDAVRVRHALECRFETSFSGSTYHHTASARMIDLENAVADLVRLRRHQQDASSANAGNHGTEDSLKSEDERIFHEWMVRVAADLERIYREKGDFAEAEVYASKVRHHNVGLRLAAWKTDEGARPFHHWLDLIPIKVEQAFSEVVSHPGRTLVLSLLVPIVLGSLTFLVGGHGLRTLLTSIANSFYGGGVTLVDATGKPSPHWSVVLGTATAFFGMLASGVVGGLVVYRILRR